ncbi:MAG: OmpA family protein [Alphaproteobacteria bacterium]|nr:MAG: OmpA family protein [Alphaproteobacteria bacterium]
MHAIKAKPLLILPLAAALTVAGCTNTGPRQNIGAGTGALAGGLLGGLLGRNAGAAAVGAGAGAILGGAIGQQLDRQAGDLRSSFGDGRIGVVNTGESLVVTMPDDITFDTDSARLTKAIRKELRALADNLLKYPNSTIKVIGHTDNTGSASHNLELSRQRAAAVTAVLVNNGVPASRIVTIGKGESEPVASNLTPEGRAQNRRVEIVIIPNG